MKFVSHSEGICFFVVRLLRIIKHELSKMTYLSVSC